MKYIKKLFRIYHSYQKTYFDDTTFNQEQSSEEIHSLLNNAPVFKIKTGLERFLDRYPNYQEMFVGSRK